MLLVEVTNESKDTPKTLTLEKKRILNAFKILKIHLKDAEVNLLNTFFETAQERPAKAINEIAVINERHPNGEYTARALCMKFNISYNALLKLELSTYKLIKTGHSWCDNETTIMEIELALTS